MAGRGPDSQYLSEFCFVFWSQISAVILMTARLWRHDQIHMGRKNHWVLLPKRSWTQISDISEFWQSGKKSRAIFDPANSGQLLLPSLLKMGGSGGLYGKEVSSLYFSIFHAKLAWNLTFFMPSLPNQLQTCNNQLWKKKRIREKGQELRTYHQKSSNHLKAKRECREAVVTKQSRLMI